MATTTPMRPTRAPRVRESGAAGETGTARDAQYDLLTAALIGAAIGATATLLLRRGPSGQRPVAPVLKGARWAGKAALRGGAAGAGWAREHGGDLLERGMERGGELIDRIPTEQLEHDVRETVGEARDRIESFVQSELKDLRMSLRRQRKRLGI